MAAAARFPGTFGDPIHRGPFFQGRNRAYIDYRVKKKRKGWTFWSETKSKPQRCQGLLPTRLGFPVRVRVRAVRVMVVRVRVIRT